MLKSFSPSGLLGLDAGNALFANAGVATEADRTRAAFVFQVMDELGTRAMAVGQRDLSAGTAFLEGLTKGRSLRLLSANLMRADKPVFAPSVILDVKGAKVAVIGVTAPGPVVPGEPQVQAGPTVDAVKQALASLGPHDVTVVLAATSYADAMQLSQTFGPQVDFVIQSGEFRGTVPPQRLDEQSAVLLASGQKGQSLGVLTLSLGKGKGAFIDATVGQRDRDQAAFVASQILTLRERLKVARDAQGRAQIQSMIVDFEQRRAALLASAGRVASGARAFDFSWKLLGNDVVDDVALKQRVLKIEPSYAGGH